MPNLWPIPNDWNEEENGYAIGVFCFPNSDQWRRLVGGAIYNLTRARNYDFETGYWKGIEQLLNDVDDSFMACDFQTLIDLGEQHIKTQRMIVAALMGQSINFDSEPLPNAINYEQGIRQAILSVGGTLGGDMTLAELIALMELQDGPDYGFKDWLEILKLFQDLFNGASLLPVAAIGGLITAIFAARNNHNNLALQAMQATALRGIQNAIAPPKDPVTEQTTVQSWLDTLEKIPFLTTAIVALVDPSPTGEGAMAVKVALALKNFMDKAFTWLSDWWSTYVTTVGNPQPAGTVVGMLSEISRKVQSLADENSTPTVTVSNRLKAISDAIENIETQGVDLTPTLVEIAAQLNDIALPDGVTWQGIFGSLEGVISDNVPIINVYCSSCGSSGGCACGSSGGSGAYGPGVEGPEDTPPITVVTGQFPTGFPGLPEFNLYKCKAANTLVLNLAELLAQTADIEQMDLTQYTTYDAAKSQVSLKITLIAYSAGSMLPNAAAWYAEKIMSFVWPYFNEDSIGLAIFEGIRLDYLTDRADAVCELYTAESISDARAAIEARLDGYIDATAYTAGVKSTAKEMYKAILSNQWLGRLFQKDGMIDRYEDASAIDCTTCGGDVLFYFEITKCVPTFSNGTGHFIENVTFQVTSCNGNAFGTTRALVEAVSSPYEDDINRLITFTNPTPGNYYLTPYDNGIVGTSVALTQAQLNGYTVECSRFHLTRPAPSDTTEFTVTVKANVIV